MKKNYCCVILSILLFFVIPATNLFSLNADDVVVLVDAGYFARVHQELVKAKESIYVEMYLAKVDGQRIENPAFRLIQDLIAAHQRGVKVKVLLEDSSRTQMNQKVYELLSTSGVGVSYDSPEKITHSKLIVIDGCKTILGSHNWSYHSLRLNHEAGLLIDSCQVASEILAQTFKSKDEDIVILDEENYFPEVIQVIKQAKESIYILMYQYEFNPRRKFSLPYEIAKELIGAKRRGVKVHLILDQNFKRQKNKFGQMQTEIERKNLTACEFLTNNGIDVQFDKAEKVTHSKLIVIDGRVSIVGSQNWTTQSVGSDQVSVLIRLEPVAQGFLQAISKVEVASSKNAPDSYDEAYSIRLPYEFFYKVSSEKSPKYIKTIGSKLYTNQAHKALSLYLLLLWEWDGNPEAKVKLDYEKLTRELGYQRLETEAGQLRRYPFAYFRLVKRLCRDLDRKYHLLKYNKKEGYVKLLDYDERNLPFGEPKQRYISIPFAFWEYGWAKKLSMKAKYLYFISLLERQRSTIKPWWFDSQNNLAERYKISRGSVGSGLLELQRHNLIEIYRFSPEPGQPYSHRWSNNYYLNELISQEEIRRGWRRLRDKYGKRNLNRARRLAGQLNEPEDQQVVERFIQLIERYGWRKAKRANEITAKLRVENPKRHIGYTIRILGRWEKEGLMKG